MEYMVFQLQAPLSSWGEPAVGEFRGTAEHPSQSALVGLLGAALGIRRDDEAGHAALRDGYGFAVGLQSSGTLLRDFHTAQVPQRSKLNGRPHATRRDEMAVPKVDQSTILSTRDYRQNAASLVALQVRRSHPSPYDLSTLAQALREPKFMLYLGRKSCPPAAPLWPQVLRADSAVMAFARYAQLQEDAIQAVPDKRGSLPLERLPELSRIFFDDHVQAGVARDMSVRRKDRLIRRKGWQFGDRSEHIALLAPEV